MNIDKICRCCMALDAPLLSIYDGVSTGKGCVADMLNQISKLLPKPGDNMPEKACLQCISEINRCYVFKMKCESSNRTLRQLLPEAVPEPIDSGTKKDLASSGVQTDENMSSPATTVKEESPLVSHSSVQTDKEIKPLVRHKEVQTDCEAVQPSGNTSKGDIKPLNGIFICEQVVNPSKNKQSLTESGEVDKKFCANKFEAIEESETADEQTSGYVLLEDSNCSADDVLHTECTTGNQKDSDYDRYEYYENEAEEILGDGAKDLIYQDDDDSNENFKVNTVYEIEGSEGKTRSDEEAESLIEPRNIKKKPKRQYKCSQCIMTFVSTKVLKRHLSNRHDIKNGEHIIDYLTDEPDEMSDDTDGSPCNSISELTPENVAKPKLMPRDKTALITDEKLLKNVNYFCDYCHAGFAQRKTLTIHMKHRVCMTDSFKCDICESIFLSEENLETHKITHETPYKCLECDTMCKTTSELGQHMIFAHKRNPRNQCPICQKVFTMKTSLNDHLRIHSGEKPFQCTICDKSFRQNSNLRQHLIRHANQKKFKCNICRNGYVTKAELFSHQRTHTGDHPFKCDICQARFTTACSLKKHGRKHTGERPYACEFCTMRFAALNVLKNHRRIHTGEKPYKCAHCPKCFSQKGDCIMHERTHISEGFKCFCESKFSKKSNLTYHIKNHHPDFSEKEIQALLDKSSADNDDTEYEISLIENTEEKFVNSTNEAFIAISQVNTSPSNNDELVEMVLEDVG